MASEDFAALEQELRFPVQAENDAALMARNRQSRVRAKVSPQDAERMRLGTRELIEARTSLPPVDLGVQHESNLLLIEHPAGTEYASHGWRGTIHMTPQTVGVVRGDLARLGVGSEEQMQAMGLRAQVHEELHGFSPLSNSRGGSMGYHGLGVWAEELATESQARMITWQLQEEAFAVAHEAREGVALTEIQREQASARFGVKTAADGGYQSWFSDAFSVIRSGYGNNMIMDRQILRCIAEASEELWVEMRTVGTAEEVAFQSRLKGGVNHDDYADWTNRTSNNGTAYFDAFVDRLTARLDSEFGEPSAHEKAHLRRVFQTQAASRDRHWKGRRP